MRDRTATAGGHAERADAEPSPWWQAHGGLLCAPAARHRAASYCTRGGSTIDWIIAALLSAVGFAVVSITDKVIMSGMGLRVRGFLLFIAFQLVATVVVVAIVSPFPADVGADVYARGLGVGIMWGAGAPLVLWSLSREEVSRVAPIWQSYPLLVVLLAVVLLGERLSPLEGFAALLAIGGAILASARIGGGARIAVSGVVGYLLIAMVLISFAQILLKTVTDELSFWHAAALRSGGMAVVLLPMNLRPAIWSELVHFARVPRSALALVVDATAAVVAMFLITFAIANGPVSLASAIVSTTPLVVFAGSFLLARRLPLLLQDSFTRGEMWQKLAASGMVVSGLTLIAFA